MQLSYLTNINCVLLFCSNVRIETISSFGIIMQAVTSKEVSTILCTVPYIHTIQLKTFTKKRSCFVACLFKILENSLSTINIHIHIYVVDLRTNIRQPLRCRCT